MIQKLLFECLHGSHLYGNNTPESDIDKRGVFIAESIYYFSPFKRVEQKEVEGEDTVYFELKKFMNLAAECNPNIVELLFVPEDRWLTGSDEWKKIFENRSLFISKKARWTFSGYAMSQLHRIKSHRKWLLDPPTKKPLREDYGLPPEKKLLSADQIGAFNELMRTHLFEIQSAHPLREQIEQYQTDIDNCDYMGIIQKTAPSMEDRVIHTITGIDINYIEILQKEKKYNQALAHYNQYLAWKRDRNPTRAVLEEKFGYDTKHFAHCYRLIEEGKELLLNGTISLPRPNAEFLLEIRNGKFKYDEIIEIAENIDSKFNDMYNESTLPYTANKEKIEKLCIEIINNNI